MTTQSKHHFFAFDLGATSGRSILATVDGRKLEMKELNRFPNKIIRLHNRYYWDIFALYESLKDGLKAAASLGVKIDAIGIDTWGVDFAFLGEDGSILGQPRSYRDPYTQGVAEEYFKLIPKKELYQLTGIQVMPFNSIYQLYAGKKENSTVLNTAKEMLFIPDVFSYLLTGKKVCEYTIASTSQLLNPKTKKIESRLLEVMDLNASLIPPVTMPGQIIGTVLDHIAEECGINKNIPVIAVAGHDTASAVIAVPAINPNFAYLSSGTWSLMGIEVKEPIINEESYRMNFTNEGGINGTIRFLKNITGMWLMEQCRKEWSIAGRNYSYQDIVNFSESVPGFTSLIDPDDTSFANPPSMTEAISIFCEKTRQQVPQTDAEFVRCILDSLALKYKWVLNRLRKMAPFEIEKLHIIGGGSQNKLLNQLTADAIGIPVVAGPSEATAIGNVLVQAKGIGLVDSLSEMRAIVNDSFSPETFFPANTQEWDRVYEERFVQLIMDN